MNFNIETKPTTSKQGNDILISLSDLETILDAIKTANEASAASLDVIENSQGVDNSQVLEDIKTATESLDSDRSVIISDGVDSADIMSTNGSHGLVVIEPNHISTDNSTSTPLGISGTFTGTSEDITNYAVMFINVYSDVASATDGLCIQFSTDNVNWDISECYTIAADTYKTFSVQCATKYFRIGYANGAVAQTSFRLQVKLCTKNALDSSHRIADSISDQDDATLTKAVLTAQQPDTDFINVGATPSGNLKVTDAENTLAIAKGDVVGASNVNKWGNAPDFDDGDGEVYIWDGAEDGAVWEQMTYTFSTGADIDSISSTSASDTQEVTIVGLDANWEEFTQTATLNGQTRVALTTPLIRCYRAYNSNSTELVGHVIIYENDTTTGGVPDDTSLIRAIIAPDNQQTEMAIYTIPAGKTGYLLGGYCSTAGARRDDSYIITFKARLFNKVFRTQQKVSISDTATSFLPFTYPIPQVLPEKTDVIVTAQAAAQDQASISAGFSIVLIDN
jgi:hypothetical protein